MKPLVETKPQAQHRTYARSDTPPGERIAKRTRQPVELPVIQGKASRPTSPLTRNWSWFSGAQSCQRRSKFASKVLENPGE